MLRQVPAGNVAELQHDIDAVAVRLPIDGKLRMFHRCYRKPRSAVRQVDDIAGGQNRHPIMVL